MKALRKLAFTLGFIGLCSTATAKEEIQYQEFTGANGKKIKAVVVDKSDTSVTFLLANGRRATVPLDKLSEETQSYVQGWNKAKATFLQKCRSLSAGELLTLRGYESIPFKFHGNAIIVPATLNGKPAKFMVDTGAGSCVFHDASAKNAGCSIGPYDEKIYGVSGEAPAAWAEVDEISIGESTFKKRKILVTDMLRNMPKGSTTSDDGLLGADFLSELDAVISYRERKLYLRPDKGDGAEVSTNGNDEENEDNLSFRIFKTKSGKSYRGNITKKTATVITIQNKKGRTFQLPISQLSDADAKYASSWSEAGAQFLRHCRSLTIKELLELRAYQNFQYQREGNHIFVNGKLNNGDVKWLIDTGADNSLLHIDAAREHGVKVGAMNQKVFGIGGEAPAAGCSVDLVGMGDAIFRKRRIMATDLDRFDQGIDYVGLFGADFMRECNAVITYREQRVFLKQ